VVKLVLYDKKIILKYKLKTSDTLQNYYLPFISLPKKKIFKIFKLIQKYKQPTRRNNNNLLVISISSTCFGR